MGAPVVKHRTLKNVSLGILLVGSGFWLHVLVASLGLRAPPLSNLVATREDVSAAGKGGKGAKKGKVKEARNKEIAENKVILKKLLEEAERLYQRNLQRRTRSFGAGGRKLRKLKRPKRLSQAERMMFHPSAFILEYYRPMYQCFLEERFAMWADVGRWICRPDLLSPESVVYTFGSDVLSQFEVEIYRRMQAEIHLFNPGIKKKIEKHLVKREEYRFHRRGIGLQDNETTGTLKSLMSLNGHSFIDLLKLDCNGCELDVVPKMFEDGVKIGQIILDIHGVSDKVRLQNLFQVLEDNGFRAYRVEQDWRNMNSIVYCVIHKTLCDPARIDVSDTGATFTSQSQSLV